MIAALRAGELDVGVGLTEAWVAGLGKAAEEAGTGEVKDGVKGEGKEGGKVSLGKGEGGYRLVGGFVESPLVWAVCGRPGGRKGGGEGEGKGIESVRGGRLGVSRIGRYVFGVFSFVLGCAQHHFEGNLGFG